VTATRVPPVTLRSAGVVLAAGASRRMGTAKAALRFAGQTFLERVVHTLRTGGVDHVVVVAGAAADAVRGALPAGSDVPLLLNPAPERGQLSSLKIALGHLARGPGDVTAAVVALVDHPAVQPATVAALLGRAAQDPPATIVVPSYRGRRGHPVLFDRAVWQELLDTPDELGARAVVHADPARLALAAVDDPGILVDVDTPSDLARLLAGTPPGE
jgi:molybdenum cofactor cytidylyltransferase